MISGGEATGAKAMSATTIIPNDYEYILWRCLSDSSAHDKALAASTARTS